MSQRTLLQSLAALALAAVTAFVTGCTGELVPVEPGPGTGGGPGGGAGGVDAGGGTVNTAAKDYYDQNVAPLLAAARPKGTCLSCHRGDGDGALLGPLFLGTAAGQEYATITSTTRWVAPTPADSLLLTYGDHTGDAWCSGAGAPYADCVENEIAVITEWINLEAQ